jgi:hypothetical protein
MTKISGVTTGQKQHINININNYKPGVYVVNLSTVNGLNIRHTFEKIN